LAYSEDLVFDNCDEAPPSDEVEPPVLEIDLCSECEFTGGDGEECSDWRRSITEIGADLLTSEGSPPTMVSRYQSPGLYALLNLSGQIDLDLLRRDVLSEMEGKGPSGDQSRSAKPLSFQAVVASALIHACLLLLFAFGPQTQVPGAAGNAGNVISVRLIATEELIPQDESPASVDSAASMPSTAGKPKTHRRPPAAQAAKLPPELREVGRRPEVTVVDEKPKLEEKEEEQTEPQKEAAKKTKEPETGEGPMNAIASLPSIASVERRFITAAGAESKAFESMVLSAIREVIFFPKRAIKEGHHGEAAIAFTINRDGSVSGLSITKTSGSPMLDEAALRIIQKAAKKFPSIPDALNKESVDYVVPILFKEKSR